MDRISLLGMAFFARHGVSAAEREIGHRFEVDVDLEVDLSNVGDDIAKTVDYRQIYETVAAVMRGRNMQLIEALAEALAAAILSNQLVETVTVRVKKTYPPLDGEVQAAEVEISRRR